MKMKFEFIEDKTIVTMIDIYSKHCMNVDQNSRYILCMSQIYPKIHYLFHFETSTEARHDVPIVLNVSVIAKIELDRQANYVACIYAKGMTHTNECKGLMIKTATDTMQYFPLPSNTKMYTQEIYDSKVDPDNYHEYEIQKLEEKFLMHNGLAKTANMLFFQNLDSQHINWWAEYEKLSSAGIFAKWKKRIEINTKYVTEIIHKVVDVVQNRSWDKFFEKHKEQEDFLGFRQKMVVLTEYLDLYTIDWDGFKVLKNKTVFDVLDMNLSPEGYCWGSNNPMVMTPLAGQYFLTDTYKEHNGKEKEDHEYLILHDPTLQIHEEQNSQKLTVDINEKQKLKFKNTADRKLYFIKGCFIRKLTQNLENKFFFLICLTSDFNLPELIAKVHIKDFFVVPMTKAELKQAMRLIDKLLKDNAFQNRKYLANIIDPRDYELKNQKQDEFIKNVSIVVTRGIIQGMEFSNEFQGTIQGIEIKNKIDMGSVISPWSFQFPTTSKIIFVFKNDREVNKIDQINHLSGNIVLQQVQDNNNMLVITAAKGNKKDMIINCILINAQSGRMLKSIELARIKLGEGYTAFSQSFKVIIETNSFFIFYKTQHDSLLYVASIQIYRKKIQRDIVQIIKDYFSNNKILEPINYFSDESEIIVLDRIFQLPHDTSILGFSKTRSSVTEKCLLVNSSNGEIFAIPQKMISPHRMSQDQIDAKKKHEDEGTLWTTKKNKELVYMFEYYPIFESPDIHLDNSISITRDSPIMNPIVVYSEKTLLESTSLLVFTGVDWMGISLSPDGLYDRISFSFKKGLLIAGMFGLSMIIFAAKQYEKRGLAKARFLEA